MRENEHLYADMARLVEHYNRKLAEDDGALWELLVRLVNKDTELSNRYAAVALRHEYTHAAAEQQKRAATFTELGEYHCAENPDIDMRLDIRSALLQLTDKERTTVLLRYYWGFTVTEISALNNVTRQTEGKRLKNALDKLRALL